MSDSLLSAIPRTLRSSRYDVEALASLFAGEHIFIIRYLCMGNVKEDEVVMLTPSLDGERASLGEPINADVGTVQQYKTCLRGSEIAE